jgi:hypothetical protein
MYKLLNLNCGSKSKPQGLEAHSELATTFFYSYSFLFSERGGQW